MTIVFSGSLDHLQGLSGNNKTAQVKTDKFISTLWNPAERNFRNQHKCHHH